MMVALRERLDDAESQVTSVEWSLSETTKEAERLSGEKLWLADRLLLAEAENERLTKQVEYQHNMIGVYEADGERLRAALEKIAEGARGDKVGAGIGWRLGHQAIEHLAREALRQNVAIPQCPICGEFTADPLHVQLRRLRSDRDR